MGKARDLTEFGKPDVVLDPSKICFVTKKDYETSPGPSLTVGLILGGAHLTLGFEENQRDERDACYAFFRRCVEENAA